MIGARLYSFAANALAVTPGFDVFFGRHLNHFVKSAFLLR
ncbi:hypothetical protein CbuK_A0003 (plasmid) [Coxiella burnetii CbuK_Q154]|nr:hypothetical protein CbuK_A0003 [Coxiella burnetii CbuK_Q154]